MSQGETGDQSGQVRFDFLYQEQFSTVYKFGYRLLGDAEKAKDLAQEVFLRLYRCLNGSEPVHDVRGWIYRTAANLSLDWIRHETRFMKISTLGFGRNGLVHEIEKDFDKAEEISAVRKALKQLRPRDRILLNLYQEELSYKEIAQATGLRRSSVGQFVSRAIKRLARQLEKGEKA